MGFFRWAVEKLPLFEIKKQEDADGHGLRTVTYLRRFFIKANGAIRSYIHNILIEDRDRDPHDHPASFLTIVISGGYTDEQWGMKFEREPTLHLDPNTGKTEAKMDLQGSMEVVKLDVLRRGSIRYRKAEHIHRVRDVQPNTWTFVIWAPRRRKWGFWLKDSGVFWPWNKYLNVADDEKYDGN